MIQQNQLRVKKCVYWGSSRTDYHKKNIIISIQQVHALETFMAQPKFLSYNQMDGCIDDLPLMSTTSNIGSASCQLVKYLAKHLSPLPQSNYTSNSTKNFITKIKNKRKSKKP